VSGVAQCARIRLELGIYMLGAIAPADRAMVSRHLESCLWRRDESAGLAGLPGLLRKVPIAAAMQLSGERPGGGPGLPGGLLDRVLSRVVAVCRRRSRVSDEPGRF
jgi:hypothetical protein